MMVVLEAVAGPATGKRIDIRAGTILRIGRTGRADYALSEDGYLSSLHFAVEFDGTQCRVRDLGSSNGTFVNGSKVIEQIVQDGDSLSAGGSTFAIHFEGDPRSAHGPSTTPTITVPAQQPGLGGTKVNVAQPTSPPSSTWPGFSKAQGNLLQNLYGPGVQVFALLDAAKDSRIPAFLDASREPYAAVDPTGRFPLFLAGPTPQSRLLDVLIKDGWGRSWCSYWMAPTSIEQACAHLAKFVTLYTVHGQPVTFRYWDPKILRMLLPAMTLEEGAAFLGPFTRIVVEGDKPELAVELALGARGPRQQTILL